MYRPPESIIEFRLSRAFPAEQLRQLARTSGLVERRRKLDLLREIADRNTAGQDSNDSLYIPPRRWSQVFSRYGGLILRRIAVLLGYDPPKENLLDLLLTAAVDPNPHRPSLIEDVQHGAFVCELA